MSKMDVTQEILSDITTYMKYSKYVPEYSRRETWVELVTRNKNMHIAKFPALRDEIESAYKLVYERKVLPSMRSLQFAGKPIELNNSRIFNCAFLPIDDQHSFSEIMFLLLSGCGVGFSVQNHHIDQLPSINRPTLTKRFLIGDSIEGWADAVRVLIKSYLNGKPLPVFDFRDIRVKGAQLITVGGKAPGPEPLKECLIQLQAILDRKQNGEKLTSDECHDMVCHIADAVLSGGIRRAALISLFDMDDENMLKAKASNVKSTILSQSFATYLDKNDVQVDENIINLRVEQNGVIYENIQIRKDLKSGKFWDLEQHSYDGTLGWWVCNPQRGRANNSAVIIRHQVVEEDFFNLWKQIESSGSGEPGFYFSNDKDWGTNPCCEIALRSYQFCNLCEINGSTVESQEDFNERVKAATFIGTLQASYTDFHYLREVWKKTTERDALLGVGITGIASGKVEKLNLKEAADIAKEENARVADLLGIKHAARITTVKPSGTSSLVLGTSSGIHAWHNDYYLRRIRVGKNESIYTYLSIHHPELLEDDAYKPAIQAVISVPQKAPEGATLRTESVLSLLDRVKLFNTKWVRKGHRKGANSNNVSATISIKADEWDEVGKWMWENRDTFNGLSVLPYDGGTYVQAPFENITEEQFNEMSKSLHNIDLSQIVEYSDNTTLMDQSACSGNSCEVV